MDIVVRNAKYVRDIADDYNNIGPNFDSQTISLTNLCKEIDLAGASGKYSISFKVAHNLESSFYTSDAILRLKLAGFNISIDFRVTHLLCIISWL